MGSHLYRGWLALALSKGSASQVQFVVVEVEMQSSVAWLGLAQPKVPEKPRENDYMVREEGKVKSTENQMKWRELKNIKYTKKEIIQKSQSSSPPDCFFSHSQPTVLEGRGEIRHPCGR